MSPAAHRPIRRVTPFRRIPRTVCDINMDPALAQSPPGAPSLDGQQGHARNRDHHVRARCSSKFTPHPSLPHHHPQPPSRVSEAIWY